MKKKISVAVVCVIAVLAAFAAFVWLNNVQLQVQLKGEPQVYLEAGDPFQPVAVQIFLNGAGASSLSLPVDNCEITVSNTVQEDVLGEYTVTYEAKYLFWSSSVQQIVSVIDTVSPEIQLKPAEDLPPGPEGRFEEPGFTATDNYDGDISERVVRIESPGLVTYAVVDSSGNPAYVEREIPYYDTFPPEIILKDGADYTIMVGTRYEEPGYSAQDDLDGDVTDLLSVQGEVDWLTPGVYPIEYIVSDSCGNEARTTRKVCVEAAEWPDTQWPKTKTIYLTFDDGPGPYTAQLLDVLDQYGVKATFFVVDSGEYQLMQEIVRRGHSIGIHSVSHDYAAIYADPEAYFADAYAMQQIIYEATGVRTTLLRFPGGSSNLVSKNTSKGIMTKLTWAVRNAGFQYFDWNVDSEDAGGATTKAKVRENVIQGIRETGTAMVLQHDIHPYSVAAVEEIIIWALNQGYQFAPVCESTPGFHHDVLN